MLVRQQWQILSRGFTTEAQAILVRLTLANRRQSSKVLAQQWSQSTNINISSRTVRRRLDNNGLKSYRPAKKTFY